MHVAFFIMILSFICTTEDKNENEIDLYLDRKEKQYLLLANVLYLYVLFCIANIARSLS